MPFFSLPCCNLGNLGHPGAAIDSGSDDGVVVLGRRYGGRFALGSGATRDRRGGCAFFARYHGQGQSALAQLLAGGSGDILRSGDSGEIEQRQIGVAHRQHVPFAIDANLRHVVGHLGATRGLGGATQGFRYPFSQVI
jgi:hypothetical protein